MTTTIESKIAKFEEGKTYFNIWNQEDGRPHMRHYTIVKRTPKTIVLKSGYRCRIFTSENGVEGAKVSYGTYIYASNLCTVEAENRQIEADKAWDEIDAKANQRMLEIKAAEAEREEIMSTPLTTVEAQDAAIDAEIENARIAAIAQIEKKIFKAEVEIDYTAGNLNDIMKNHYKGVDPDGSWEERTAELGAYLVEQITKAAELKTELAALKNNATTVEVIAETEAANIATGYVFSKIFADGEVMNTSCKIIGDENNFDNSVYREVVFFDPERFASWELKTADGKLLAKGNSKNDAYKFLATETDGSEDDEDEVETFNVMPAEIDDTEDELVDEAVETTASTTTIKTTIAKNGAINFSKNGKKIAAKNLLSALTYKYGGIFKAVAIMKAAVYFGELHIGTDKIQSPRTETNFWQFFKCNVDKHYPKATDFLADVVEFNREYNAGVHDNDKQIRRQIWFGTQPEGAAQMTIDDQADFLKDKIACEVKACDDNNDVFKLLPAIESLNDVDTNQTKDEMKAAADQMGLMQLNRKIADLEEQLIDNRLAATAVLDELNATTTFAEQKEIERRYSKHAAISDALIDEKAIYNAAKFTRLSQIAAIKNLMSKSETATVEEVKTDAELQDEFTAELAKLETEKAIAKEKEENAKVIYKIASDNYEERRAALQNFLDKHATRLNEKIATDIPCKCLKVITQKGEQYTVDFITNMHVDAFNGFGKRFIIQYYHGIYFAHYDTPAQVETVIDMLKAAIERGDEEFTFPTVDELNNTANDEPDNSASTIDDLKTKLDRLYRHKALLTKAEFEHMERKLTADIAQPDKLTAAEKNVAEPETTENAVKAICERVRSVIKRGINHVVTSKGRHMWYEHGSLTSKDIIAVILAKEGFTIEEYISAEKTAEDYWWNVELPRMVAISNQATFLEDKHWREVKSYDEKLTANVMPPEVDDNEDELIDPPDKADIHDSLARAMKITLLKVQDFCRKKNLKAAQNELSLYNICANAMRELRQEVA